jgi:hypothetical protein
MSTSVVMIYKTYCIVQDLLHEFDISSGMFDGLTTEYRQMKYFKQCGYYISPESYVLGQCIESCRGADDMVTAVPVNCTAQHVSLCKTFKAFFEMPNVLKIALEYINRSRVIDAFEDFFDGQLWTNIKAAGNFGSNVVCVALPYKLYFDEFETGNPLGS